MSALAGLEALDERVREVLGGVETEIAHGELTVRVAADRLVEVLRTLKHDEALAFELLADLSAVHWPAGEHVIDRQPSTTGWPAYRVSREQGVIEVVYILRSLSRNHWLRVETTTPDDDPRLPSATGVWETADFHEREVYDFFGVVFEGHPHLVRILMPDDWVGHPHRKDYPLGGVDVPYHGGVSIPSPEERDLREMVHEELPGEVPS